MFHYTFFFSFSFFLTQSSSPSTFGQSGKKRSKMKNQEVGSAGWLARRKTHQSSSSVFCFLVSTSSSSSSSSSSAARFVPPSTSSSSSSSSSSSPSPHSPP